MAGPQFITLPLDVRPERLALLVGSMRDPAILESGPGFGEAGRWSIYAAEPLYRVQSGPGGWSIDYDRSRWDAGPKSGPADPEDPGALSLLDLGAPGRALGAGPVPSQGADDPPFRGGYLGFFGYDLAPGLERLPRKAPADSRMPDVSFGYYDTFVLHDRLTGSVTLAAHTGSFPERVMRERLSRWRDRLMGGVTPPARTMLRSPIASNFTRSGYEEAVERALEYIRAGDIFQVNLSQRFEATGRIDALDLYLRLRERSPAPFSAFLRWGDMAVVSASPEWFYQTRGDRIVTRPIKGTRPRGASPEEDARLAEELRLSPKDRAELTMIIDLERNDLGRVCAYGSVRVTEPLTVESYSTVHHLVATVEGRLRRVTPSAIVRAMFPGGSITGAPKIRAMEIIDELEPTRRGLYTGAIGYHSACGASAFNIAIRTFLVEGDRVTYQVGGGIVADSDPRAEYEETLHKGRALREVLEGA